MKFLSDNTELFLFILPVLGGMLGFLTKNQSTATWFGCMYIGNVIFYWCGEIIKELSRK